MISGFQRVS